MVASYDYFPTLLDYLGLPPHKDPKLPGHSYAPFLRGKSPKWRNRIYFEYSYMRGMRTETLKYVERTKEWPSELYDMETDPGEKKNVIADPAYQKEAAALRGELDGFFEASGAPPIEEWRKTTRQKLSTYRAWTQ
jgi:arylsulfatase A-like enzyme